MTRGVQIVTRGRWSAAGCLAVGLACACGSPRPVAAPAHVSAPAPPPSALDPTKAPRATSVFNVSALRAGARTAPFLRVFDRVLPNGVAIEDVAWLGVDGNGRLDGVDRNIIFISRPGAELLVVRHLSTGFSAVDPPASPRDNELVRVLIRAPAKLVRVPFFAPPGSVDELTLIVETRDADGAEFHLREHCADAVEGQKAVAALDETIARVNGGVTRILTRGLLNDAKATLDGTDARLDVSATGEQVEALVQLALTLVGAP